MTVSANPTPDFQRDQILTAAIRLCGLLEDTQVPSAELLEQAAFHFNLALQDLQSVGVVLRTIEQEFLPLVNGQATYNLASDTIDVELAQNDIVGTIVDSAGTVETQVRTMSRGEYLAIAIKNTLSGYPSRCYIEKLATVTATFWPIPDSSSLSFRYTRVRLLRSGDTGAVTMDLRNTWTPYMVYAVASGVALNKSLMDKFQLFKAMADEKRKRSEAGDVQHGAIRFRVGHRGRNW